MTISDELLQKSDDPVADLKAVTTGRLVIVVPNEWNWPPQLAPMKNPSHKRFYDADLLVEHLEAAGWETYILRSIESGGWSWLSIEAVRGEPRAIMSSVPVPKLDSKERRKQKRAALQRGQSTSAVTPSPSTSNSETAPSSAPAGQTGTK